ncbi:hypothetical protein GCM10011506_08010 [Marivirga lumbricoides]|uniref:Macroglobulin domain-containing protein n=2 Tax=Marivirga lumbricoides TaxID=1046115 RepID=A0ABQ1LI28_9BACT|nr:hypothetical protein GCM10011506_08010 [Marivirga lumbricoides]
MRYEKVYLNTDKPYYISGDKILFSVYVVSYGDNLPSGKNGILYLNLIDSNNELILDEKVKLTGGTGSGFISIPPQLKSGSYTFLMFTKDMVNFNRSMPSQNIGIININDKYVKKEDSGKLSAEFFPEGGNLVSNHLNQVAVELQNFSDGLRGLVVDEFENTVAIVDDIKDGYGKFKIFPNDSSTYTALFINEKDTMYFDLGKSSSDMLTIKLTDLDKDTISVFLNLGYNFEQDKVGFLLQNKGRVIFSNEQRVTGRKMKFLLPKGDLPNGLNQIVIYDSERKILSERIFYLEDESKMDLDVIMSDNTFNTNEEIEFSLRINNNNNDNSKLFASVSVKNLNYFEENSISRIDYDLNLFSEINFIPLSLDFYTHVKNIDFLDNFLLTKKIETFNVDEFFRGNTKMKFQDADNLNSIIVSGKVYDSRTNELVIDSTIYCTVLGSAQQFYISPINAKGEFKIEIKEFNGTADIILKLANVDEKQTNIMYILDKSIADSTYVVSDTRSYLPPQRYANSLIEFQKENQIIKRVYYPDQVRKNLQSLNSFSNGLFKNYDFSRDMREYVVLKNFEEVVRELIPGAVIKVNKSNKSKRLLIRLLDDKKGLLAPIGDNPLVLIDGLPVYNQEQIFLIEPEDLSFVKLINKKVFINGKFFDGILEIETDNKDYYMRNTTNHSYTNISGFSLKDQIKDVSLLPDRSTSDKLPDFRSILYWNPEVIIEPGKVETLKFSTSDDIGDFLVEVQGMNNLGNPIYFKKIISVK